MGFREMFRLLSLCLLVALFALGCHAHNHKVTVDWNAGFSSPAARAKSVTAGKHIVFSWTGTHNVYKMADKAAFDACNFAGSTQVGGATSPVTYNTSPSATGHIYFACKVGSHCSNGQKLDLTLTAASGSASGSHPASGSNKAKPKPKPGKPTSSASSHQLACVPSWRLLWRLCSICRICANTNRCRSTSQGMGRCSQPFTVRVRASGIAVSLTKMRLLFSWNGAC